VTAAAIAGSAGRRGARRNVPQSRRAVHRADEDGSPALGTEAVGRMNRTILALLLDYHRRTLGVWVLLVAVQLMQVATIWVLGNGHMPIIGTVIASLSFCGTWDSPNLVMRTLPITARELALLRWWERIAMPMVFITLGYVLAWISNYGAHL